MMNCKHATRLLSEKLDRELTTKEKISLKMHITMCSACRKFGNQMGDIRKISRIYVRRENLDEKK